MNSRLAEAIIAEAKRIGANPHDLATVISYETGGTFDPWVKGPTTKWGTHRGLIQMGEPQRKQFGYYEGMPIEDAVRSSANYLVANGFKPGMGLLDMYSTINAGAPGLYDRSDEAAGGAPGTVQDKVEQQMGGHKEKATALLGGQWQPSTSNFDTEGLGPSIPAGSYDDVSAPSGPTIVDINRAEAEAPKPYNDFFTEVGAHNESSGLTAHLIRSMTEGVVDPDYRLGEERGMELAKQYPDHYHDMLFSAGSERMLRERVKWVDEDMTRQARLQAGGLSATLGSGLVAGIIDPIPLAVGVATGGVGGAAIKGGWMARAAAGAASGAAINAAMDWGSKEFNDNPYADPIMAGAVGGLFGAFGGALARNPAAGFEANLAYDAANRLEAQASGRIPQVDPIKGYITGTTGNLGAARAPDRPESLIGDAAGYAIEMADSDVAYGFGGALRKGDVTGQMTTDDNPLTRLIGAHLFEEVAGFSDGSVVPDSVNSKMTSLQRVVLGNFSTEYGPARDAYVKAGGHGLNIVAKAQRSNEFNRLVGDYVAAPIAPADADPNVVKAASALRKGMATWAKEMRDAGLWEGNVNDNYLPLVANHQRISELDQMVDPEVMQKFIKGAIREHSPTIADELADRMARGYWANIRKAGFGIEDGISRSLHLSDREAFKEEFLRALEDKSLLSSDELDQVYDLLTGTLDAAKSTADGSNGVGYLKKRTLLDYAYSASVPTRTGQRVNLAMRDLFERDAEMLFRRYTRSMAGRVAFAKTKIINPSNGEIIADGIRSESDLAALVTKVKESYRQMPGDYRKRQKQADNAVNNIMFGWKRINGIPVFDQSSAFANWARRLKSMQFIRLMSNMGLNQVQEGWKIISLTGARAALSQMPSIGVMVRGVKSGAYQKDKLLTELGDMTGIGLDHLWSAASLRMDEDRLGTVSGRMGQAFDSALDFGQQVTAQVSLMRATHDYQQRWALKAITQQMVGMARKARQADGSFDYSRIKEMDRRRLASIGLGEDDAKLLFKNLLSHSEFEKGKITGVNINAWDADAISKYRLFLGRYTDRLVQQNDFGALSKWMSQPVASMFVQFRSFVFGAWAKSTLWSVNNGLRQFDPRMMVLLMGEIAAGTATYVVRQAGLTATDEGKEKFTEEVLNPVNLAKQGWARTATASVIPMFIDSLLMATPVGPQFGSARASGTASDAWLGTPVTDQLSNAQKFAKGGLGAITEGRSMTQGEVTAGVRAFMPLGNWVPFTAGLGALIKDLPESNR